MLLTTSCTDAIEVLDIRTWWWIIILSTSPDPQLLLSATSIDSLGIGKFTSNIKGFKKRNKHIIRGAYPSKQLRISMDVYGEF